MGLKLSPGKKVFSCPILAVKEHTLSAPNDKSLSVYTMDMAHWVNIVPITRSGEIVLIEQLRFGTDSMIWETPGGAVEANEKDLTMAALRELEEETGLTTQSILALPGYFPNPAIQGNRITFFLAFNVEPMTTSPHHADPFEVVTTRVVPAEQAFEMARTGQISHALAALALLLAEPYIKQKFGKS
jgi:ADP-ribose pyrophosphatase